MNVKLQIISCLVYCIFRRYLLTKITREQVTAVFSLTKALIEAKSLFRHCFKQVQTMQIRLIWTVSPAICSYHVTFIGLCQCDETMAIFNIHNISVGRIRCHFRMHQKLMENAISVD